MAQLEQSAWKPLAVVNNMPFLSTNWSAQPSIFAFSSIRRVTDDPKYQRKAAMFESLPNTHTITNSVIYEKKGIHRPPGFEKDTTAVPHIDPKLTTFVPARLHGHTCLVLLSDSLSDPIADIIGPDLW